MAVIFHGFVDTKMRGESGKSDQYVSTVLLDMITQAAKTGG